MVIIMLMSLNNPCPTDYFKNQEKNIKCNFREKHKLIKLLILNLIFQVYFLAEIDLR